MLDKPKQTENASPFHAGEQEIQSRVGKREKMEGFGRRMIRSFMPDQHREFYAKLPFLVVGSIDREGWPWASIVPGRPGFVTSPDAEHLQVDASAIPGDPLEDIIAPGAPLGLLGIEVPTRRRNRMNGRVTETGDGGFKISVDQAFGNCPQYIQTRSVAFVREPGTGAPPMDRFRALDDETIALIGSADTFFVSSHVPTTDRSTAEGVDVSHRGGRPGFVRIDGDTLTIPDYSGNNHFNTLGNFLLNPRAGLTFIDFSTGDLLMLSGTVEILWEDEPEVKAFAGAERGWRFRLDHGIRLRNALPFRFEFSEASPANLATGSWVEAEATLAAEARREAWRPYRVAGIEDESSVIRSFYLEPADGGAIPGFEAGQFLTIRTKPENAGNPALRTYTVSSAPGDPHYRISVKLEQGGMVSRHLHKNLQVGDVVEAKAPRGQFFMDATETRPVVLLGAGVGITPMIAMARHIMKEGNRTRHFRNLTVFHAAQKTGQRAFEAEFRDLEHLSNGAIRYRSIVSRPHDGEQTGVDFDGTGHITAETLRQTLPLDDYDFYLCGPGPFMQSLYDTLRGLGVPDARILAEAFGPAALNRQAGPIETAPTLPEAAENAAIRFSRSGFDQHWSSGDGSLLETAEAHGLSPEFGCRTGSCGSCAVKLKAGAVTYRTPPSAHYMEDEVLVCCAVPAKGSDVIEIDL
jgi:ferredoxin-NADP reductase/predicted pyridoxine 5'-phosphate oxidase superfamily flavin-nucleotide-binding protein